MRWIVFDLDHTLLTANSSFKFGAYLYHQKFFSTVTLIYSLISYARHKYLKMSVQSLHNQLFEKLFKNRCLIDVEKLVNSFLTKHLDSLLYLPAIQRLREAQYAGDRVMILSSSPHFLVGEIAKRLGVKNWQATVYQVNEQGKFSFISSRMEGNDKALYIKKFASQMNLSLSTLTVYSDSYLDLPLLKIAGHPVGVKPDKNLRRICLKNGWEMI